MAIRMMSGLPARIIAVLQDYLPTELDLIDAEEADGIVTPDIETWIDWDQKNIPGTYPACSIRAVSSAPIQTLPVLMGQRIDAEHRVDVMFHAGITESDDPSIIQKLMLRYISGAARVLCVQHEALDTVADPTRLVELVSWVNQATYGPEAEQQDGTLMRTATLPIAIRRIEEI